MKKIILVNMGKHNWALKTEKGVQLFHIFHYFSKRQAVEYAKALLSSFPELYLAEE